MVKLRYIAIIIVVICVIVALNQPLMSMISPQKTNCTNCVVNYTQIVRVNNTTMAARTPAYYMTFVIENGCPYCQQEQPIIAAFQKTHPTIEVTTINISTDPAFVQKENIKLTPTMIIYKEGKEIARLENVQPLDALNSTLK